jgi:hypothetical protein
MLIDDEMLYDPAFGNGLANIADLRRRRRKYEDRPDDFRYLRPYPRRRFVPVPITVNPGYVPYYTYDRYGRCYAYDGYDGLADYPATAPYDLTDYDFF